MSDDFERLTSFASLRAAALRAARGARRSPSAARYLAELERETLLLERELRSGRWRPLPLRAFRIRDPKPRTIHSSDFRDRVVHHAIIGEVEPAFERVADPDSYACRRGRGNHAAVRRLQRLMRGHRWALKLDIHHYFETMPHAPLLARVRPLIQDPRVFELLARVVAGHGGATSTGIPIGALTSQHLANLYLGGLDRYARRTLRVGGLVRYMDDVLLLGPDRATMRGWREDVRRFVSQRLGLTVKESATRLIPVEIGVPFLGFRVWERQIRLDGARVRRLRRRLRTLDRAVAERRIDEHAAAKHAGPVLAWARHANAERLCASYYARRLPFALEFGMMETARR